jgi:hypothetical protein
MSMKVTRRQAVGVVGAAFALAPSTVAFAAQGNRSLIEGSGVAPAALHGDALLAPLSAGAKLGAWLIHRIGALNAGAVAVELLGRNGERFHLDICACDREVGAAEPPARTARCDIFVANEGAGNDWTVEDHGLAAMALAELVRTNEHRVDLRGLETLRTRLRLHGDEVRRGCPVDGGR